MSFTSGKQVTCVGSKAPGEVLANLIIAFVLFLIFEVQFLEVSWAPFRTGMHNP
jgi:hypothetical protein